jgi:predicted ABC-type ATPase
VRVPKLTVVAGPNGSGKSTLIRYLQSQNIALGTYINADDIAKAQNLSGEDGSKEAQRIADGLRDHCLKNRSDFSFETVMSHESKPMLMEQARAAGFHVTLYFVCTDNPQTNVSRVDYRVQHGGHNVPVERIIARYHRTLELLPRAIRASDLTVMFDNSVDRMTDLNSTLRPILSFRRTTENVIVKEFEERPPIWAKKLLLAFEKQQLSPSRQQH